MVIRGFKRLAGFERDLLSASHELQDAVEKALKKLLENPQSRILRMEKLSGFENVYTIHITGNHSHKLSFNMNGDIAVLRRLDTHKSIDRNP